LLLFASKSFSWQQGFDKLSLTALTERQAEFVEVLLNRNNFSQRAQRNSLNQPVFAFGLS